MKVGGYQIIDLENRNLQLNVGMVYDGIYDLIEATRKPTLLSGIQINGIELHDGFVDFIPNGSSFVTSLTIGEQSGTLTVTDTDVVTVTIV